MPRRNTRQGALPATLPNQTVNLFWSQVPRSVQGCGSFSPPSRLYTWRRPLLTLASRPSGCSRAKRRTPSPARLARQGAHWLLPQRASGWIGRAIDPFRIQPARAWGNRLALASSSKEGGHSLSYPRSAAALIALSPLSWARFGCSRASRISPGPPALTGLPPLLLVLQKEQILIRSSSEKGIRHAAQRPSRQGHRRCRWLTWKQGGGELGTPGSPYSRGRVRGGALLYLPGLAYSAPGYAPPEPG